MSVSVDSQTHQELQAFNHQEARFTFQHSSFIDSLSLERSRTQVIAVLAVLLVVTLSCILGCVVFAAILIEHQNYHAASWAFLTGAVAAGTSTLFILHLIAKLEKTHDRKTLEGIKIFGLIMCVISGMALGVYLILGVLDENEFTLEGENYYSASLFSALCLGVSLFLYFVAQWYQNAVQFAEAVRAVDMQNIVQPAVEATQ